MNYKHLQSLLDQVNANIGAAGWHGALCGLLCADNHANEKPWLDLVMGDYDSALLDADMCEAFNAYFQSTFLFLNDPDFSFTLLLPDDDIALAERTEALGAWCNGFVCGLGVGGYQNLDVLSGECKEAVEDIVEIAKVSLEEDEHSETDELNFLELSEYVRVSVIMLTEELRPDGQDKKILH